MFQARLHQQTCVVCRLRQNLALKRLARSRCNQVTLPIRGQRAARSYLSTISLERRTKHSQNGTIAISKTATFHTTQHHEPPAQESGDEATGVKEDDESTDSIEARALPVEGSIGTTKHAGDVTAVDQTIEEVVRKLRQSYGDRLPDGLLSEEQGLVWQRLYGRPLRTVQELEDAQGLDDTADNSGMSRFVEGEWEEVELAEEEAEEELDGSRDGNGRFQDDIEAAVEEEKEDLDDYDRREDEFVPGLPSVSRLHPLTLANRFSTNPSTIQPPKETLTDLISALLSGLPAKRITSAAHRVFGGFGLPDSTSTPRFGKVQRQENIPLDVSQSRMSNVDADVYMAVIMTAVYSSTMSVLVETRKRLGTAWAEALVRKAEAGKLQILDAGGAGMGILAVRDILKAEWERMHEEAINPGGGALTTADGKIGGAGIAPPLGNATVYIASDALRDRASHILKNTTFIPRMPDYEHTTNAKQTGKYDIVVAPHTIWPIREAHARRLHVSNLWNLLNADGGVLCLLEKGVARGFEAIATARQQLLRSRIAKADASTATDGSQDELGPDPDSEMSLPNGKETGMIIAPCTSHVACPMYKGHMQGLIKGRKDICHFRQRYIRPAFLQNILGAKDKNFEDIKISYLSVMRGGDLRATKERHDVLQDEPVAVQGKVATDRAFEGYSAVQRLASDDDLLSGEDAPQARRPSSLSLPRAVLPPIKRRGHIILDVCTPGGEIERWTVPRSYSKQAFHDARKSDWGDLWALGAKTRVDRTVKLGKHARREDEKTSLSPKVKKEKRRIKERKAGRPGMLNKIAAE